MAMYRSGVVTSSNTTSADPSPCGLGPATTRATAGRVASAALVTGKPVSGAVGRAELSPAELPAVGPLDTAAGEDAGPGFTGLAGPWPHAATASPVRAASPAAAASRAATIERRPGGCPAGMWHLLNRRHLRCTVPAGSP